ncbi:MAG: glycosyltransferase family 2 protein [Acidilobaceae archaeon]|jgi:GT2 family glycosyltransferase
MMIAIVLINYNSWKILSLERLIIFNIKNESNTIFYLVDNASSDNSDAILLELLKEHNLSYRYYRLPYNIGFVRAVNFAFRRLDKDVKYVVLLNNDLVPVRGIIGQLVDVLESGGFAGVQGTIMQLLRPWLVDNAGHVVDRFGLSYPVCRGRPFSCAGDYEPSYLSGAFSIYRVDVLRKLGTPFSDVYEAYFDDKLLGARLRKRGYRIFHKAIAAGFHLGSASYGPRQLFKSARWFKHVSAAELIPVFKNAPLPVKIFAMLKFLGAGIVGSLFSGEDYVRSFVEAVRFTAVEHPEAESVRSEFFSFLDFLLQNPFIGIEPPKNSKTNVIGT